MPADRVYRTIVDQLARRYSECFTHDEVAQTVAGSRALLERSSRHPQLLPALVGHHAHDRLIELARQRCLDAHPVPEILFICEHNEGRSQMAAALAEGLAPGHVHVRTAGARPSGRLNPDVVRALHEYGIDLDHLYPEGVPGDVTQAADVVVRMGCDVASLPGRRYVDWEIEDPQGRTLAQVRAIRDRLHERVRELLEELEVPVDGPLARTGGGPGAPPDRSGHRPHGAQLSGRHP